MAATGLFDSKNVGTGKTVALTSSYSGADVGNYAITNQASTTADVTKKTLGVSGIAAASKVYDGNSVATVSAGSAASGQWRQSERGGHRPVRQQERGHWQDGNADQQLQR
ncbi:MAG: YDG domain-containing protein [Burkholderiales bacterium]|nr:YDG domain-containing protein [Burkholderiales bacterium]